MRDSTEVAFNLQAELKSAQSELSALREENERRKSESFEELYNAAIDERDAMREELAKANEKIDQAWNRGDNRDCNGFIPGALDAWKRPVPQHLPDDFSGNPGASATQYCNGWNDCGGYWSGHASDLQQRLTAAEQRNADLTKAIADAEYRADQGKVWNGMGWTYTGLHSHAQQKVIELLRAALKPTESGASE